VEEAEAQLATAKAELAAAKAERSAAKTELAAAKLATAKAELATNKAELVVYDAVRKAIKAVGERGNISIGYRIEKGDISIDDIDYYVIVCVMNNGDVDKVYIHRRNKLNHSGRYCVCCLVVRCSS